MNHIFISPITKNTYNIALYAQFGITFHLLLAIVVQTMLRTRGSIIFFYTKVQLLCSASD
nr:MAG TPA: hypothetical protein [Bacteriophage sp.]